MESVLFANDKGPEKRAEVTWPVPFPVRRPPRVVEPVPPKLVESVVVPMTEPLLLVRRRALVILLMAKLVLVASRSEVLPRTVNVEPKETAPPTFKRLAIVVEPTM